MLLLYLPPQNTRAETMLQQAKVSLPMSNCSCVIYIYEYIYIYIYIYIFQFHLYRIQICLTTIGVFVTMKSRYIPRETVRVGTFAHEEVLLNICVYMFKQT